MRQCRVRFAGVAGPWLSPALLLFLSLSMAGPAAAGQEPADPGGILVEIFLARDQKTHWEAIRKEFESVSIVKVRPKFFPLGHPPENIAIGKNISAPIARLAIRLAVTYNRDVKLLLPEKRLAANYLAIGTSIFDESFQVPITPEDLRRLSDPALTTEQFHLLYRRLTGEESSPE